MLKEVSRSHDLIALCFPESGLVNCWFPKRLEENYLGRFYWAIHDDMPRCHDHQHDPIQRSQTSLTIANEIGLVSFRWRGSWCFFFDVLTLQLRERYIAVTLVVNPLYRKPNVEILFCNMTVCSWMDGSVHILFCCHVRASVGACMAYSRGHWFLLALWEEMLPLFSKVNWALSIMPF